MEKYSKYKDSGVAWIGEIPEHWEAVRLKFIGQSLGGLTYSPSDICEESEGTIVLRSSNIKDDELCFDDNVYVKKKLSQKDLVQKRDILICSRNGSASLVGKSALINDSIKAAFGAFMMIFRPTLTNNSKYIHYLIQVAINKYKATFKTSTINQLTNSLFSNIYTPYVDDEQEQILIVNHLNNKNKEINSYISNKEKEKSALDELKQVIIAEAVTRGINKNAPMKNSGIAWIGEIPEHWDTRKIKFLFQERSEKGYPNEPVLSATQSRGVIPQSLYENRVVVVNKGFENLKLVCVNDFVISLRSFQGGIEYAHYRGIISAAYTVLTISSELIIPAYIRLLFKSHNFILLLKTCVVGIREGQNINYALLKNKFIPIPPLEEQQAIVDYINQKVENIDKLKVLIESQITALKEYKQRLISDVVTGKVKVTE